MTLTKEQIEESRNILTNRMIPEWCVNEEHAAFWLNRATSLCDLALERLALKPRPLAEIDKTGIALVVHVGGDSPTPLRCYGSGQWKLWAGGEAWPDTTLAIPLSALSAMMEVK